MINSHVQPTTHTIRETVLGRRSSALHRRSRVLSLSRGSGLAVYSSRRGPDVPSARGRPALSEPVGDITLLLRSAKGGDARSLDRLMEAIYDDLRRLALSHLRRERADHTLQPTALVHEAYLKLIDQRATDWNDRLHFFAVATQIIRRILIDHARERKALKRGGAFDRVGLDPSGPTAPESSVDLLALDEALTDLAALDERQAKIVELRYFGGCTIDEIAELLDVGRRTVDRDWMAAKAWLFCRLSEDPGPGHGD